MVEVKGLHHSYGNASEHAVEDVSFSIGKGEIFGFLGPSGAGKSTTQAVLSGLLPLQRGEIIIAGESRDGRPDKAFFNRIGVGFEIPNVYRKISGLDNLRFHASLYDGETMDPTEALEMVGLAEAARKKAGAYSKGMMQRLGFARSMINKPEIWFLDEPTMGLDPTTSNSIKAIIRRRQSEGATIFLTTHNMYVADELCDRVAFIVDGRIVAMDAPKNLKLSFGESVVNVEYREDGGLKAAAFGLAGEDKERLREFIARHEIATIHSGEPTLEDVFVRITGRGLE